MPVAIRAYSALQPNSKKIQRNIIYPDLIDNGHTIVMKIIDADDRSQDELYVDGHYIHPDNWNYDSRCHKEDRSSLQFLQHPSKQQRISLGGRLVFSEDNKTGQGVMYFADTRTGVILEKIPIHERKALVGTYDLTKGGNKVGVLTIHPKGMIINGMKPKKFELSGNKATWKGITGGGIFREGSIEFSVDGDSIIRSSFNGAGRISRASSTARTAKAAPLSVQELLLMYPFNEDGADVVQRQSMEDFFLLIQYFMPEDYLHDFIRPDRPQLDGYLRLIAIDDEHEVDAKPGDNAKYYESLVVPYLTYALSTSLDKEENPDIIHLNYIRSDNHMKTTMQNSPVYNRHSGKMYRYHWRQMFPRIDDYLRDQEKTDYTSTINAKTQKWIEDATEDLSDALGQESIDNITEQINEIGEKAIANKQYWAFAVIQDQASTENLNKIKNEILYTSKGTDDLIRDHERYSSILSILDPTAYFTEQFTLMMELYQLTYLLPQYFDPSSMDDLNVMVQSIAEGFVEKYIDSPDPDLAEYALIIQEKMVNEGWEKIFPYIDDAASKSTDWLSFYNVLKTTFKKDYGDENGEKMGYIIAMESFSAFIATTAVGLSNWSSFDDLQRATFLYKTVNGVAFIAKKFYSVFVTAAPGWLESCKEIYYKGTRAISTNIGIISGAIAKWIVKHVTISRFAQRLLLKGILAGPALERAFKNIKMFGSKFTKFMAARFDGIMGIVGIIYSSIFLSTATTDIGVAMNAMYLASSILDVVAHAIKWLFLGAARIVTIGGFSIGVAPLTAVSSIASGLAAAASFVGLILLIIITFSPSDPPPDPVKEFCNSQEVKNAGYYMKHGTTIEYFQVEVGVDDETKEIGISMTANGGKNYFCVQDYRGRVKTSPFVDYTFRTVLTVYVDDTGKTTLFTKQIDKDDNEYVLHLTVDDNNRVSMKEWFTDEEDQPKQLWDIVCMGNAVFINEDELESATFTIYNEYKKVYLTGNSGAYVDVGSYPQEWTIKLECMRPFYLSMDNIVIKTSDRDKIFESYLGQPGSSSERVYIINPELPDFLEFDEKIGSVSQKKGVAPVVTAKRNYSFYVKNPWGSSEVILFSIEVIDKLEYF